MGRLALFCSAYKRVTNNLKKIATMDIKTKVNYYKNKEKQQGLFVIVKTKTKNLSENEIEDLVGLTNIKINKLKPKIENIEIGKFDFAICKIYTNPFPTEVEPIIELVNQEEIIQFI